MEGAGWLSQGFAPPDKVETVDEASYPKPAPKPARPAEIGPRMAGIRTDGELAAFLDTNRAKAGAGVAVVEYGTAWCTKCHEMFPAFYALSKKYSQHDYAVAQLETLSPAAAAGMRYTPTFAIYRGGRKVDEVVGKEPRRLEDHLWLHAD